MNTATVTTLNPATKRCWKCDTVKAVTDFSKDKSRQDGLQPVCKPCAKEARVAYLAENPGAQKRAWAKWYAKPENAEKHNQRTIAAARMRAHLLIEKFKSAPCMDCHQTFPTCAMDFDHRPGAEKYFSLNYSKLGRLPLESIMAEIAKCDLVCSNCHRIRTNSRGQCGQIGKMER